MIDIDGSMGEGGGQILRSSLGLSLVTGEPIRIDRIRAARKKPGLMRQHLACVRAAAVVGCAEVSGDEIGSTRLEFRPGHLQGGHFAFAISGAGSTILVIQTVLPALLSAPEASTVVVRGGTHNPLAPSFDFFDRVFLPVLRRMGARVEARLDRHGFFPAGGGAVTVHVEPVTRLNPVELLDRGELTELRGRILLSKLPATIGEREQKQVATQLGWPASRTSIEHIEDSPGPGNVVMLEAGDGTHCELITGHAMRGLAAERVAHEAATELQEYLAASVPVGVHLADQLLIPMALAGGGLYRTHRPSLHTTTNAQVVQRFLGTP
ncbi:MAG: RNA 3'-terminal phosphate cyclase, partial [Planctomycetes bacterium]|nr:RNA 3'-terminal phosphate cyclase [Planctomycetota bacterium]